MYSFVERRINIPDNIDIVSIITDDLIANSPLNKQLSINKVNYINPVKNKCFKWSMTKKIPLILMGLAESTKEYCLVLDGADVVMLSDLDDITERFLTYGKKVLYNATIWRFPDMLIDLVEDRSQYGRYNYLNAGCCFGKTEHLFNFYELVQEIFDSYSSYIESEQFYIRKAFDKQQNNVFFDYNCKIFQNWHINKEKVEGNVIKLC
jgi:hypothetical protein